MILKSLKRLKKYGVSEQTIVRLTKVLNNIQNFVKDNPILLTKLHEQTGYTKEQILADAEFGKGPVLLIDFNTGDNESQQRGAFASFSHTKTESLFLMRLLLNLLKI